MRGPVLLPLFSHNVCLDLTSLFQGFLQNNVNLSRTTCELGNHPVFWEETQHNWGGAAEKE